MASFFFLMLVSLCAFAVVGTGARNLRSSKPILGSAPSTGVTLGDFVISWSSNKKQLSITSERDEPVWTTVAGEAFLNAASGQWWTTEIEGMFNITSTYDERTTTQTVDTISASSETMLLSGSLTSTEWGYACPYSFALSIANDLPNQLSMDVTVDSASCCPASSSATCRPPNKMTLRYFSAKDEQMFGMGMQYTKWNLRGNVVPVLSEEQGVGRGRQPITTLVNEHTPLAGGDWATQYGSCPHLLSSTLRTLYLTNTQYAEFDLAATTPEVVAITTVFRTQLPDGSSSSPEAVTPMTLSARVFRSASPLAAVGEYTKYSGRMAPLPAWAVGGGAIVGLQGGNATVLSLYRKLKAAGVPIAALWIQDWSGTRISPFGSRLWWNWVVDRDQYPDWAGMLALLRSHGVRVLTYINPYLENTREPSSHAPYLFPEAARLGYLVRNSSGQPYIIDSGSKQFTFASLDFTNPAARSWYADVIRCNMLGLPAPACANISWPQSNTSNDDGSRVGGQYGWMADFGEYLPFDSTLHSGTPSAMHNLYPQLWSDTTRAALAGLDGSADAGQAISFHRSSASRSPALTSLYWEGDQLVTWDSFDGIGSAVLGAMTGPLSGAALMHSDIGGYTMLKQGSETVARTPLLLMRWMELSAFCDAVFRSHQGNLPSISAQVYTDKQTMAHFALTASWHASIAPYRTWLMQRHVDTGEPLVRHPWLHYWDTDAAGTLPLTHQFMLGPHLMMKPVITDGATSVTLYLPAASGTWSHMWSGVNYTAPAHSGRNITLSAPLGQPAVVVNAQFMRTPLYRSSLAKLRAIRDAWLLRQTTTAATAAAQQQQQQQRRRQQQQQEQ